MTGWDWAFWTAGATLALAGLLLCAWSLLHDRPRGCRRCPKCWYDMSAVPGLKCPECGREARTERAFFRTRRRWRWASVGALLGALGAGTAAAPVVGSGDWVLYVPPTLLNPVLACFDHEATSQYDRVVPTQAPGFLQARAPMASLSQWQRLLIARRCAILLEDTETTFQFRTSVETYSVPVRRQSLYSLRSLGKEARVAAPALVRCCRSGDDFAPEVISYLGSLQPAVAMSLLRRVVLKSEDPGTRISGLRELAASVSKLPALADVLAISARSDRDETVRAQALYLVPSACLDKPWGVRILERGLADRADAVRIRAVEGLSIVGKRVETSFQRREVVDLLSRALLDRAPAVRGLAATAISCMPTEGQFHADDIRGAYARERDAGTRLVLAISIGRLRGPEEGLPLLVPLLHEPDADVARGARRHVEQAARSGSANVRLAATRALEAIGSPSAAPDPYEPETEPPDRR